MRKTKYSFEQFHITQLLLRRTLFIVPVSVSVALFLWLLDMATQARWQRSWLIYLLLLAGVSLPVYTAILVKIPGGATT